MPAIIQACLALLDPDVVTLLYEIGGDEALPVWRFEHEGWRINFRPIPKKPAARGKSGVRPIGARFFGFQLADHWEALRDAITDKAGRYGELSLPYVIAVHALDLIDQDDILDALFGQEQWIVDLSEAARSETTNAQMSRKPNGVQ